MTVTGGEAKPWWHPDRHEGRRPLLQARNRIQAAVRGWLAEAGFTEVDPAGLQASPGNEAHLHAFATEAVGNDGAARRSGATASGGRCMRPSSPCWNGIGPGRTMPS